MKAVALSPSRDPELVDRPDPRPAADEVVIRPPYCGICGSDLHAKENQVYRPEVVLGHKFAGEILQTGPEVRGWKVGQLVAVNPNGNVCHRCTACRSGRANLCTVATLERPAGVARDGGMAWARSPWSNHPRSAARPPPASAPTRRWLPLVGVSPRPVAFDPFTAINKAASILTGFIYVEEEFAQAALLLASGAVDVDTLTTAVVPLERFADAFAALGQPESTLKVLIGPKQGTGGSEATTTV
jgi:threonine dehydrogenase-like Zn-dependent dehydrogenase